MLWKDRCRITEDEELSPIEHPFLRRREVLHTEEAGPLPEALLVDVGACADDTARIELQVGDIAFAADLAKPDQIE
jgi:hypothetical protein